jgi:16S rRNA (cytidine1402-2'-O)-methyltransferase
VTLVVVATPIGNLGDLAPRARRALEEADLVCCEDTRRTRALLSALGVPAGGRLLSLHAHNETARAPAVLEALEAGRTVVLVSDAGMPTVSDPGGRLVAEAAAAGVTVTCVPGPSAVLAALAVSGLGADRFSFEGFLPRKGAERRRRLDAMAADERAVVFFEAPGRVAQTLADVAAAAPDRPVAVCRELTKVHEEVWRGAAADAAAEFAGRAEVRGEVVVVLGPLSEPARRAPDDEEVAEAARARLAAGDATKEAAEAVSAALGVGRRRAYDAVLAARRGR